MQPHGLQPTRLLCPWDFPSKSTGVVCHFLLQGIFPTQGLNLHLLLGKWVLYHWVTREAPVLIITVLLLCHRLLVTVSSSHFFSTFLSSLTLCPICVLKSTWHPPYHMRARSTTVTKKWNSSICTLCYQQHVYWDLCWRVN